MSMTKLVGSVLILDYGVFLVVIFTALFFDTQKVNQYARSAFGAGP